MDTGHALYASDTISFYESSDDGAALSGVKCVHGQQYA
jgi:hypothetical protein